MGCAFFWQAPGTPLGRAAHHGDLDAIRALLESGADPNQFDATGQTPLHWAARGGHPLGPHRCLGEVPERLAIIDTLVTAGGDLNLSDRRRAFPGGSSGWTPLHLALHHEQFAAAARMLARGADPNVRTRQGKSAMAMAADEGAPTHLLADLLARGFDPRRARKPQD